MKSNRNRAGGKRGRAVMRVMGRGGVGRRAARCEEDSKDGRDSKIGEGDNTCPRCDHD